MFYIFYRSEKYPDISRDILYVQHDIQEPSKTVQNAQQRDKLHTMKVYYSCV